MVEGTETPNERYKVGRVLAKYGLEDLHAELPDRWLGEGRDAQSLRELAEAINVAVLRQAMESAGTEPLEGEAENAYRLLVDDDVSVGVRTQQRNQMEREGIDVDELESDFVTHQAVHTYLKKALDVSKERDEDTDPLEKHEGRIQRLRSRTEAVTENSLDELVRAGHLDLGEHDTIVNVQVYCRDCGTQYDVSSLLQQGGCDCPAE